MEDYINESAEIQEVAEPETNVDESAETQGVAEPEQAENPDAEREEPESKGTGRTEADAAFAELRREKQQLERSNQQMMEALSRYFEGETAEDLSINAMAYADQRDPDEYREEWEHNQEFEQLRADKEDLEAEIFNLKVEKLMQDGLREIQVIDPSIKSLDEVGESFPKFIAAGLSSTEAYWACKAQTMKEKVLAPSAIGKVADAKAERDYYTSEEIDDICENTPELLDDDKVWAKVMKSMERLGK